MYDGHLVGALHRLASGEPPEAWDVPPGVLGVGADVYQVHGLGRSALHQGVQLEHVHVSDSVLLDEFVCVPLGGGYALIRRIREVEAVRAILQLVPGEHPSGGAVFESDDVLHAHALEQPGADDAPRATGAVDYDAGVVVQLAEDVADVQRKLAVRGAAAAGDAVAPVLLGRARVENDHLVAAVHPALELYGVDLRDVVLDLHLLAEVLAGHVDSPLCGTPFRHPAGHAALHRDRVAIAESSKRLGGERRSAAVVVAQHDRRVRVRNGVDDAQLKIPARDKARSDDVRGVVLPRFPDVDQRKRPVAIKQISNFSTGYGWRHNSSPRPVGAVRIGSHSSLLSTHSSTSSCRIG